MPGLSRSLSHSLFLSLSSLFLSLSLSFLFLTFSHRFCLTPSLVSVSNSLPLSRSICLSLSCFSLSSFLFYTLSVSNLSLSLSFSVCLCLSLSFIVSTLHPLSHFVFPWSLSLILSLALSSPVRSSYTASLSPFTLICRLQNPSLRRHFSVIFGKNSSFLLNHKVVHPTI